MSFFSVDGCDSDGSTYQDEMQRRAGKDQEIDDIREFLAANDHMAVLCGQFGE